MADEDLTDEERKLLEKHRAERAKKSRKVTVKGRHDESGAEYSFDLDGDDADRVISRHRSLFEDQADSPDTTPGKAKDKAGHPYFKGKSE